MITQPVSLFHKKNYGKLFRIILHNDDEPTGFVQFNVEKLPVRYNKKHAITYEMDDSLIQIYSNVFRLLNGGKPADDPDISLGISHSNGFGNLVKFRGSSVGNAYLRNGNSILDNYSSTMYINWNQHLEMYNAGWGLMGNHGAYSDYVDIPNQTMQNWETLMKNAFNLRYGRNPLFAVLQGGDLGSFQSTEWINWLINNCHIFLKVMGSGNGPVQMNLASLNLVEFLTVNNTVFQTGRYLFDGKTPSTIKSYIDTFMTNSGNLWLRTYSHSVKPNGQTEYTTFKEVMQHIQTNYGSEGLDNIWFPSVTELIEYAITRENTLIQVSNPDPFSFDLYFDVSNVPNNIFNRSMTLKITSDYPIKSVITSGYNIKFSGVNTNSLIVDLQSSI